VTYAAHGQNEQQTEWIDHITPPDLAGRSYNNDNKIKIRLAS